MNRSAQAHSQAQRVQQGPPRATPTALPRSLGRLWRAGCALGCFGAALSGAWAAEVSVPTAEVGGRDMGQALVLSGSLQAVRQSTLSAQTSGRVVQLLVQASDRVKAGQLVAVVDDRQTQAGLSQAQAQVAQADAEQARLRAEYERTQRLHAQGFLSQAALDGVQAQYKAAQAGVKSASAGQAQSQLAQGFTRITAAYDGWVQATHVQVGDLAQPGVPVATVYAPQPLRAVVQVPASSQASATRAQRVEVQLPDGRWVSPSAKQPLPATDAVSQTVEWRLDLSPAASASWSPGQQVQVRWQGASESRLSVPASALLRRGELTAVYVVQASAKACQFVLRSVRVGDTASDTAIEVLAGVRSGERVALDPVRAGLAGAQPQPDACEAARRGSGS